MRLVYPQKGQVELQPVKLGGLTMNEVAVKALFSGISRGTEALVYNGLVPESQWNVMACPHMGGHFPFPVSYGYQMVGEIAACGTKVEGFLPGDRVFVLHPHQNMFHVFAQNCTRLPEKVPPRRAVLAANMETALNAIWDAQPHDGQKIAIFGAGVVGLLTGYALKKITGISPKILDISPQKRAVTNQLGFEFQEISGLGTDQRFDLMFNTSGAPSALQTAIDHAAFEAKIVEMSWYGDRDVRLNLGGNFHSGRLTISASQVGHVAPSKRKSHSYARRMREALDLLDEPLLDKLIEPEIEFTELPNHLPDIFEPGSDLLCQLIRY
ncbi:MAG: zinc-binding alcohol dehydrogenase [Pseudomonadota bacterium]